MTQRRRVSPSSFLALLAIITLVSISYFPLSRTRAASVTATVLPSAGKPLVNFKNAQSLKLTFTGSSDAVGALQNGSAVPTALASADFDADGAIDVVAGYSTGNGGVVALFRGNKDAFSPTNPALYPKAIKGSIASTFLSKAQAFSVPESPDLLATGDFNRDGFQDVLVGTKGSTLYLLAGDGTGNLLPAQIVPLTGQVRALAVLPDGHVAVSLDNPNGSELAILSPSAAGLIPGATFPLPASGDSVAWGNLGGGADIAVGAGKNIALIYNTLSAKPQTETVTVPFQVMGLALGDFIWDQDGRTEISVLADDGSVQILQHGALNTTPLTAAQIPARRKAYSPKAVHQPSNPTALGTWTVAKQLPYTGSAPASPVSASAFSSPHVAQSSTHDVMVLDAGRNQLNILDTSGKTASPSAGVSFSGTPVAALALPQKIDASRDVVVLTSAQSAPMLIAVPGSFTFNVNSTADGDSVGACATNSSVTTPPSTLSLREAVCIANNNGASTVTINVPAGTYSLSASTFGGDGSSSSSPELQVGIQNGNNITISGAGAGSTIIQQAVSGSRIIEADQELNGSMPLAVENLTLQNGNCTDSGLDCLDNGGGAILAGGVTGDTLTITNVTFNRNTSQSASAGTLGGAVLYTGSLLSITGSTFSSNTASGTGGAQGGAVQVEDVINGNEVSGSVTITNSIFSGNSASSGNDGNANGGGLFFEGAAGFNGSVTGSAFTGNTASSTASSGAATGGGIDAGGGGAETFSVSNSRIVGNSVSASSAVASGFYGFGLAATLTNNWWGCNGGPGASGCDTFFFDTADGGSGTFNPWLVLSVSANPTSINTNATSTLTADLTHNSSGTGGFSVPNGTPVTFSGTLDSSVNPSSTTLTSGEATSTYTAGSTSGTGSGIAKVDNQQVSTPINILVSVTVTTSPANLSITVDGVGATAPQTYSWVVGSSHTIATSSPQSVSGGTEQVFSTWSDGGAISHSVTAPSSSTTYTADFTTQYQLTTVASPSADGTVTPPSGSYFASGASIPVAATANAGFAFNNWTSTGGSFGSTTAASTTFAMPSSAATVTGNFVPVIVAAGTTTSLSSNNNPSFTQAPGNSVTFTATVTSNTTVNEGTVTFSDTANDFTCSGGNTVPVSNGQAACTTSFTTEGARNISAAYNGTVNFQTSSGFITQVANNHTVQTGNQFCNQGPITIPSTAGAATPYPSNVFVTGLSGNIGAVTINLNNISSSDIQQTDLLLVGPTGAKIIPFASVGDSSTIGGVNITLDDTASSLIPGGSPLVSGSYKPTSITGSTSLLFPAPAPTVNAGNYAATDGSATLTSTFQNTAPNGTWALYAIDHEGNGAASIGGGWCVNISPAVTGTSIAVTNVNPSSEVYGLDSGVTITAVLSWTGSGPAPTASDVTIGGNGPSGYSATSCGTPSGDAMTCMATYTPTVSDTVGTYTETANFSGDSNYSGSSSTQTNNFSITQATSSTSVSSSLNPSLVGQQVTFTATINGQYGLVVKRSGAAIGGVSKKALTRKLSSSLHPVPATGFGGTVTWSANTGCSPSTVSGDPGTAQCVTTTLPQGTDTITATYSGDTNHSGSSGTLSGGQVVNPVITGTSIAVTNVNPSSEVYGLDSGVTITAVLSWTGSGPAPTASDVTIGGNGPSGYSATSCGTPSGDAMTCMATYTPTASDTVGTYTETASFSGDSNYSGSSSTQTNNFSITQATSSTSVSSSLNPSLVGQQVTFTATINGQYGLVVKRSGAAIGGVSKKALTRKLSSSLHPVPATGFGGTVTWSANTGCSPSTVSGDPGTAQCVTTTLPQGTDTITATYSGDTNHSGSSGTLSGGQVVNPVITGTSIAVTNVNPSSEVYGLDSGVTITAVLSWTGSGPAPTASDVTIGGNGPSGYSATSCGTPSGDAMTCTATYTPTASDTVGTYTETASFSGDSNYSGSSSTQTNNFSITQATSSTSVSSSLNPSLVGQQVTFTATIDGQYGMIVQRNATLLSRLSKKGLKQSSSLHPVPATGFGGTVTWSANTGCSPSTVSGDPGTAQCVTTTLPQGTDTITATYSGDTNHKGSTGTLSGGQVVNAQAEISITPTSINFETVYLFNIREQNVTIKNTGTANLDITNISLTLGSDTNKGDYTFVSGCPKVLTPGKSCIIGMFFFAGNIGTPSATLNITDNAAGSPQHVDLSATVINPVPNFKPPILNLPTTKVGRFCVGDVILTNVGTTALDIKSIKVTGANASNFKETNACPASLAPNASCTIAVTFTPSKTGTAQADLTVTDNAQIGTQNVPLSGKGD